MTDTEILLVKKAAMFDLLRIFGWDREKSYTVEEIQTLIMAYVAGSAS